VIRNALLPLYSSFNFWKTWATLSPFHRLFSDVTLFHSMPLSWGKFVSASNHRTWEKWSVCHKSPCSFHLVLELCTLGCVSHAQDILLPCWRIYMEVLADSYGCSHVTRCVTESSSAVRTSLAVNWAPHMVSASLRNKSRANYLKTTEKDCCVTPVSLW
jgi:hypothetical protein